MCLHVLLREQGCRGGIARIERLKSPFARVREISSGTDCLDSWIPPLLSDLLWFLYVWGTMWLMREV
ncbi:hypothetical protein GJAV_G00126340 [Gymnothorax javanicus]|nr:hypothetical protein GJAV_G00126340 [Gymnothorax javanicus]